MARIGVHQNDRYGCGIACIATVIGKTYDYVKKLIPEWDEYSNRGLDYFHLMEMLGELGLPSVPKYYRTPFRNKRRENWVTPVCEVNIVGVFNQQGVGHYVVWYADNKVFCPNDGWREGFGDYANTTSEDKLVGSPWLILGIGEPLCNKVDGEERTTQKFHNYGTTVR